MTADGEVSLTTIAEQLGSLTDLFRRRLQDDRLKQSIIEDLQGRLTRSERATSAAALKPIVENLLLIVDRVRSVNPADDYRVIDELEYVLESVLDLTPILPDVGESVDRLKHEVVSATGEGQGLIVVERVRAGYEKDGVVFRPAKVTVARINAASDVATEEGDDECAVFR